MKNILLLIAAFVFFVSRVFGQSGIEDLIKKRAKLVYRIDAPNRSYDCIISIKEQKPFSFDYTIVDSSGAQGSITNTLNGLKNGSNLSMQFEGGNKTLDDNTTSILLSKKMHRKLSGQYREPLTIRLNGGEPSKMGLVKDTGNFVIKINGVTTIIKEKMVKPLIRFNNQYIATGSEYFSFYDSQQLPILLKMRKGVHIELLEIKTE